jgi:hypothetical protein
MDWVSISIKVFDFLCDLCAFARVIVTRRS